ncbi:EH signature domain-containing protein [Brevibacterium aurantiacum]|uniref:Zorya protein ZorC EH domain-containing protein n=1 Tax=Brevibacterium aurantiacum TaxID=273384 RepID=A0A2A3YVF6_BREAU|nr:EH signature domain-containing protein [Brevibacterium aurantiacum]PCC43165.1 hypothetical protein CIK65_07650 [Brevibacterium aurantiacum]
MILDFTLPSTKPTILRWSEQELSAWEKLSTDAEAMSHRVDNPGLSTETSQQARTVLDSEHPERHPELANRKICRAVVTLWAGDLRLARDTMRVPILQTVCENGSFTRLFTFALANLYFTHFDRLDDWDTGLFAKTADYLHQGVSLQARARSRDALFAIQQNPELSMGMSAPEKIAQQVLARDSDLPSTMREVGLGDYSGGRYAEIARQRVYLDRIAQADPRQTYTWLEDLCDSDLADAPATDGRRFGHLVIEAMTSQPVDSPSREWESTILKIADDPRARGTINWNKWWSRIPPENLRRVIAWLSGEDIRLFLEAVEIFGKKNGKDDLLRMFPDREHFLKGLLELKLVRETRLFAGPAARSAIRQIMGDDLRTNISQLSGMNYRETAVIFMNCGKFHVIEGSHNFRMWVIKGDPPEIMSNWRLGQINSTQFLNELRGERSPHEDYVALTHNVHKKWISDALLFIDSAGEYVPPEAVMSPATYQKVSAERPLPVRPKNWRRRNRGAE